MNRARCGPTQRLVCVLCDANCVTGVSSEAVVGAAVVSHYYYFRLSNVSVTGFEAVSVFNAAVRMCNGLTHLSLFNCTGEISLQK